VYWIEGGSIKVVMRKLAFITLAITSILSAAPCKTFAIPGVGGAAEETSQSAGQSVSDAGPEDTMLAQAKADKAHPATPVKMDKIMGFNREGVIIGVDKDKGVGVISAGSAQGVKVGEMFAVVRVKDKVIDPSSGEVVRVIQEFVGSVEAISVSDAFTDVRLDKGAKYILEGDSVRRKPSTPSGVSIKNVEARKIEISWDLAYEPEVKGFNIYRSLVSRKDSFELLDTVSRSDATTYQDKSTSKFPIVEGSTYYYRISSYNLLNNESDPSDIQSIKAKSAPNPPEGFKAEGGKVRSNYLEWTPLEGNDVGGYKIYRANTADGPFEEIADLGSAKDRDYTDYGGGKPLSPGLADSVTYSYKIAAYNIFKTEGPQSKAISATTAAPPTVPTGFSAKGMQPRMVPLTWDIHTDTNVKGYIIFRSDQPDGPFTEVAKIQGREIINFVDKGAESAGSGWGAGSSKAKNLEDAHLYFYKVQAYNWVDSRSEFTNAVSVLTKPVSFPPENFTATSDRARQVPLEWRPVPDVTIDWYEVFRSETEDGDFKKLGAIKSDKSYYLDEQLPDGMTYYYKVRAIDKFGLIGEFTEPVSATTKKLPSKVSGVKWEIISGEPTLLWDPNPEVDIKEYIIYEKGFFGWSKAGSSVETKYVIKGLASGSTSSFSVSAADTAGLEGEKSESITVRP